MIELRHYRYFVAVAEELNFRRAAARLHIDQTPIARTIRDLEEQLGVSLFVRMPRGLRLTPAGLRLLKEARNIFIRLERTRRAVSATDARHQTPLRIAVTDGISQPKLSECFVAWNAQMTESPLELSEIAADRLASALRAEEIDAGISFGLAPDRNIAQQHAWSYPLMALVHPKHELASSEILALADLLAFPLISYKAEYQPGLLRQLQTIVHRHSQRPLVAAEACSLAGYVALVAAGIGVGVTDAGYASSQRRSDIVAVPLREDERIVTLVLHKHRRFGNATELHRFLVHVRSLNG